MRISKLVFCATLLATFAGCNPSGPSVSRISGHYEGSLTDHSDRKTYQRTAVSTDVDLSKDSTVAVKDANGAVKVALAITNAGDDSVTLQSSIGMTQAMKLAFDPGSQCYAATDSVKVTLCAANIEISLEIQNPSDGTDLLSLVLYRSNNGPASVKETPRSYNLSDAMDRARSMSFASRIEFEHVVQAKLNAKAAYLHLLPQISLGTVVNNLTPSASSLLGAIGDLAPFLLPDRWLQADAANKQSRAEQDTRILMRLDMGVQVEGLFYGYARDKATRDLTQQLLSKLSDPNTGIRHQVQVREEMGQLPVGSTTNIDLLINQTQQSLVVLDQVKIEDLGTISQTLGYFDPTTVTEATVDGALDPIDSAPDTLDYTTIRDAALSRSFERDQMDNLIAAAHDTKTAEYFTFLDPYGDPNLFLSFALPSKVGVAQSQINELQIDKQQIESILAQKVLFAVTDYAAAVSGYKKAQEGMIYQNKVLSQELETLQQGVNVDFPGLTVILQNYLAGQIAVEAATANYRVARAEIDRLLLQGNYAKF